MKSEIITINMIEETQKEGKKVARLNINRILNKKSIQKLKEVIKKSKTIHSPLQIINGEDAIKANLEIVDWKTKEKISEEEAKDYIVILDGQHRWEALQELLQEANDTKGANEYKCWAFYPEINENEIPDFLKDLNTTGTQWDASAFMTWKLGQGDDILISKIHALSQAGYKYTAACEWMRLKEGEIKRPELTIKGSRDEDEEIIIQNTIAYGERLLTAAKKSFSENFCQKKTLPSWIIERIGMLIDAGTTKEIAVKYIEKFLEQSVGKEKGNKIENQKGKRGGDTKDQLIRKELSTLFSNEINEIKKLIDNN